MEGGVFCLSRAPSLFHFTPLSLCALALSHTHKTSSTRFLIPPRDQRHPDFSVSTAAMEARQRETGISARMRAILIDWMWDVHGKYRLYPETMYLAVSLLDRYLQRVSVHRGNLQLLGLTALFLATKHEECWSPDKEALAALTDNAYSPRQILEMEASLLRTLAFRCAAPTPHHFLCAALQALNTDERSNLGRMASALLDRSLQEADFFRDGLLAASSASALGAPTRAEGVGGASGGAAATASAPPPLAAAHLPFALPALAACAGALHVLGHLPAALPSDATAFAALCRSFRVEDCESVMYAGKSLVRLYSGWDAGVQQYAEGALASKLPCAFLGAPGRCTLTAVMKRYSSPRMGGVAFVLSAAASLPSRGPSGSITTASSSSSSSSSSSVRQ